jgi:hypothetical protein
MQVIVYLDDSNRVCVITPNLGLTQQEIDTFYPSQGLEPFEGCGLTLQEIAEKDVPPIVLEIDDRGIPTKTEPRPYLIIEDSELPDRIHRDRWVIQDGKVVVKDEPVENS